MKNIFTIIIILSCYYNSISQIANIPDVNFKNALLEHNPIIDTNNDGEIQLEKAQNTTILDVNRKNISSLEGIRFFRNNINEVDLINKMNCFFGIVLSKK